MVACGDDYHVARQLIELHKQERYDPLDLTRLVRVPALFADRVEFIKKQHARLGADIVEEFAEPGIGFAEIAADQCVVADHEERQTQRFGHPFRVRSLPVPWRARKKHTVTRLVAVGTQDVSPDMFLDQLTSVLADRQRKQQVVEVNAGHNLDNRFATGPASTSR